MAKRKKGLYLAYLKQQKEKQELELKKQKYNIENENIVIEKNKNIFLKTLILIVDMILKILKVLFYIGIGLILTIGATVLINQNLREQVLSILKLN